MGGLVVLELGTDGEHGAVLVHVQVLKPPLPIHSRVK